MSRNLCAVAGEYGLTLGRDTTTLPDGLRKISPDEKSEVYPPRQHSVALNLSSPHLAREEEVVLGVVIGADRHYQNQFGWESSLAYQIPSDGLLMLTKTVVYLTAIRRVPDVSGSFPEHPKGEV